MAKLAVQCSLPKFWLPSESWISRPLWAFWCLLEQLQFSTPFLDKGRRPRRERARGHLSTRLEGPLQKVVEDLLRRFVHFSLLSKEIKKLLRNRILLNELNSILLNIKNWINLFRNKKKEFFKEISSDFWRDKRWQEMTRGFSFIGKDCERATLQMTKKKRSTKYCSAFFSNWRRASICVTSAVCNG